MRGSLRFLTSDFTVLFKRTFVNKSYQGLSLHASGTRNVSTTVPRYSEPDLLISVQDGVRTIRLNRPNAKNALNAQMYKGITQSLHDSNKDDKTVVNVITGTGDFFCSGNDMLDFLNNARETDMAKKKLWQNTFEQFVGSLIDCEKPLIVLVNGPSVGIGVTALGLADVVYSVDKAYFITPFSALGICPEACSSYTFPRIMGYGKANEMITFGARFSADEAQKSGLVTEVFSTQEFASKTRERVNAYAKLPVKSLVYSKTLVRGRERALLHSVNSAEGEKNMALRDTTFHKNAVESFVSKKKK